MTPDIRSVFIEHLLTKMHKFTDSQLIDLSSKYIDAVEKNLMAEQINHIVKHGVAEKEIIIRMLGHMMY